MNDAANFATVTLQVVPQHVQLLAGEYAIEAVPTGLPLPPDFIVATRSPDGITVVRPSAGTEAEAWVAFFSGGTAHDLSTPGMTASIVGPLSSAGLPIFVASTATADLVFVPAGSLEGARTELVRAGHQVTALD